MEDVWCMRVDVHYSIVLFACLAHDHTLQEVSEHQLAKETAEEEMRDLMDTVEMATLDKEMAEERVRIRSATSAACGSIMRQ